MVGFADLPFELLRLVVVELNYFSLKSLSLVNKTCRSVSTSDIFRTFKVEFSDQGMRRFSGFAASPFAKYVRVLHYDASELVDPLIQNFGYFAACIYTPQEYARDQRDFRWELRGKQFSYKETFLYFKRLAKSQGIVLKERTDIQTFTESLQHLSNLATIKLSFDGAKEDQLLWFSNRCFLGGDNSLLVHFEAILKGMAAAQPTGLVFNGLEIDGMHSKLTADDKNILQLAEAALAKVERLTLIDSPGFLEFVSYVPLPSLRRIELAKCWFVGLQLEEFLTSQDGRVLHAYFKDKDQLYHEIWNSGGDLNLKVPSKPFLWSKSLGLQESLLLTENRI